MCVNLTNQKYAIKNKIYIEEEYHTERKRYMKMTKKELRNEYEFFLGSQPRKSNNHTKTVTCFGENLQNAKESKYVFDGDILENVSYSYFVDDVKDSMDVNY